MNTEKVDPKMNVFRQAVESIEDLKGGYRDGLRALGPDSKKVSVKANNNLLGSVDIDGCTKKIYPNESRWDYAIGYNQEVIFIEVHPANTSNVNEMINKVLWLKTWLKEKGKRLEAIRKDKAHYWIPSGKNCISRTSPQYRRLAKYNLVVKSAPFAIE